MLELSNKYSAYEIDIQIHPLENASYQYQPGENCVISTETGVMFGKLKKWVSED